jgi:hypothetical protein
MYFMMTTPAIMLLDYFTVDQQTTGILIDNIHLGKNKFIKVEYFQVYCQTK